MSTNAQDLTGHTGNNWDASKRQDERVFRVIFLFTFPFFLVVALLSRVLPAPAAAEGSDTGRRGNVFAEAGAAARSTIALALMN